MAKNAKKLSSERTRSVRRRPKPDERRLELRNSLWPDAAELVWDRVSYDGWTTVPRLLPLVMVLIKNLSSTGDPSGVYFDLWSRVYDEGLVTIANEADCAFSAGYSGTRAVRTWRERMFELQELGFIKSKKQGAREFAQVLILDPVKLASRLQRAPKSRVAEEWWTAFVTRAGEIGAEIPA